MWSVLEFQCCSLPARYLFCLRVDGAFESKPLNCGGVRGRGKKEEIDEKGRDWGAEGREVPPVP